MPPRHDDLPAWARAADALAIALLFLAAYVAFEGGFVAKLAGLRLSVRSEWRVLLWASILLLSRHVLVRAPSLPRRIVSGIARVCQGGDPLVDDGADAVLRERQPVQSSKRFVGGLVVVGVFSALTAVMTYPQILGMGTQVSLNDGDPLFSVWRLAWIAHQLPRDPLNLFNANIFHPERGALAFSDSMIVPALMTAPLLWLGVPQLVAYNLVFLSSFALSGAAMFLLVRSLTGRSGAALVAGFIFAFLPYRYMHYPHLELQVAQWMPLCLWAFHRTIRAGRVRDGLLTGLFLALQALSSLYYGIFLATFMVPVGLALLIAHRGSAHAPPVIATMKSLAAGGVLAAVLIVPIILPYFAARDNVGERPVSEIQFYSATARNYLAAHPQNVVFGSRTSHLGGQERELFTGFLVPLVALIGLWPPLSATRIAYALGLILAFEVSLGFNGLLYPWLHEYVLPYRGLRVPARMAMVVGFGLAVLAGFGAARLLRIAGGGRQRSALVALALTALVAVEYYSVPLLARVPSRPSPIYDALPLNKTNVLFELPLVRPDIAIEPLYMYFSTFHWSTLVNGYSGFSPPSYERLHNSLEHFPDTTALAELRRRGVTHIVIHGALYNRRHEYDAMIASLDGSPELERVAAVEWQRHPTILYRLLPPDPSRAAADGVSQ
jgi:hypothetical protein